MKWVFNFLLKNYNSFFLYRHILFLVANETGEELVCPQTTLQCPFCKKICIFLKSHLKLSYLKKMQPLHSMKALADYTINDVVALLRFSGLSEYKLKKSKPLWLTWNDFSTVHKKKKDGKQCYSTVVPLWVSQEINWCWKIPCLYATRANLFWHRTRPWVCFFTIVGMQYTRPFMYIVYHRFGGGIYSLLLTRQNAESSSCEDLYQDCCFGLAAREA